jgi:hypothetical protein
MAARRGQRDADSMDITMKLRLKLGQPVAVLNPPSPAKEN